MAPTVAQGDSLIFLYYALVIAEVVKVVTEVAAVVIIVAKIAAYYQ